MAIHQPQVKVCPLLPPNEGILIPMLETTANQVYLRNFGMPFQVDLFSQALAKKKKKRKSPTKLTWWMPFVGTSTLTPTSTLRLRCFKRKIYADFSTSYAMQRPFASKKFKHTNATLLYLYLIHPR